MKYLLLVCYFVSAFLAMLFSTEYYKCIFRRAGKILAKENPSQEARIKKFTGTLNSYIQDILMFSSIAMVLLPVAFITLYLLQNSVPHSPLPVSIVLDSGIHVPIILLLSGYIIRKCFQRVAKTHDMFTIPMMKKAIMYMALTCDIALITLDLTLGLFIFALILGKFIWIDFVYDDVPIKTIFARIINDYKNIEDPTRLCVFYAIGFLTFFFVAAEIYYQCICQKDEAYTGSIMLLYILCEVIVTISLISRLRRIGNNNP